MNNHQELLKTSEIGHAVKKCSPHSIAVAYVGNDWDKFVKVKKLEKIIISPTIGTNPYAIEALVKKMTWSKIFFLDNLHTKMYIGDNSVIIGSSNLSRNGLSVSGLEEVAIVTEDENVLKEAKEYFVELQKMAEEEHPEESDKKKKLAELKITWSKNIRNSVIKNYAKKETPLQEYSPLNSDDFYVVWHSGGEFQNRHSEQVKQIEIVINDEMHVLEKDNIKVGKWILAWQKTNKNKFYERTKPRWIFIDEIFSKGISDEEYEYTKIAIEREDRKKIEPPFELDEVAIDAFKNVINDGNFPCFTRDDDKNPFSVEDTFPEFENFITALKKEAKKVKAHQ